MHKPTSGPERQTGYGIGWNAVDSPSGIRVVSHTGGMGGVNTVLRIVPSEKLAVVVLCNARSGLPGKVADEILKLMAPKWRPSPPSPPQPLPFPQEVIGTWKGKLVTYKAELPFELKVTDSRQVLARVGSQMQMLVNDVRWENGFLTGRFQSDIHTEDANRRPYFCC
jgi:CubicO group peptidase (beta-lactamase class C family)